MVEASTMVGRERLTVVKALVWEQWRQTRVVLAIPVILCGLVAFPRFILSTVSAGHFSGDSIEGLMGLNIFFMGLPFLIVPFSHCDKNNLQAGLPQRTLALPVSTGTLGSVYLGYRMLALGATAFILAVLTCLASMGEIGRSIELPFVPLPVEILLVALWFALIAAVAYAYLQAILWTLGSIHLALGGVGLLILTPAILLGCRAVAGPLHGILPRIFLVLLFLVGVPALAYAGFALERKGVWASVRNYAGLWLTRCTTSRMQPFRSAMDAQVWFEWRRSGRIFVVTTLSFALVFPLIFGYMVRSAAVKGHEGWGGLDPMLYLLLCQLALGVGAFVAGVLRQTLDYRDHATGLNTFTMTRCMSTRRLAMARLRATARSVGLVYIVFLAGLAAWIVLTGTGDIFLRFVAYCFGYGGGTAAALDGLPGVPSLAAIPQSVVFFSVLGFLVAVGGHALLTWAVVAGFGPLFLTLIGAYVTAACTVLLMPSLPPSEQGLVMATALLGLEIAMLSAFILWGLRAGKRRQIAGTPAPARTLSLLAAVVVTLSALFFYHFREDLIPWSNTSYWSIAGWLGAWMIGALACVVPFTVTPVWVHWLRHR